MGWGVVETDGVPYFLPESENLFENIVSQVTAHHFENDGFLRTHFLPNRGGAPIVSLCDKTGTMCESLKPPKTVLPYKDYYGKWTQAISANHDCIYTHYPPLSDWIFGISSALGFDELRHFKTIVIVSNCALLTLLFFWLKRRFHWVASFLSVVFAGTLPTFIEWGDTLMYHGFQFTVLIAGIWSFELYIERRKRVYFLLTWFFYLVESLLSYQLTAFYAIALFGTAVVTLKNDRSLFRPFLFQLTAPIFAFSFHFCLIGTLIGFNAALKNLAKTFFARTTLMKNGGFDLMLKWVENTILPLWLMVLMLVLVIWAYRWARRPVWPVLFLMVVFFVGGLSFSLLFPGTTSWHFNMMHRHFMPFSVILVASAIDAVMAMRARLTRLEHPRLKWGFGVGCVLSVATLLGIAFYRNARFIGNDIQWNLQRNRHYNAENLVGRSLESFFWTEGSRHDVGIPQMASLGMHVAEPPGWRTDFRFVGMAPSHYEVWWLEPVPLRMLRLLIDQKDVELYRANCAFSFFDGEKFVSISKDVVSVASRFTRKPDERRPPRPYAWLTYRLAAAKTTRAVRLTCSDVTEVALRQIEAFEKDHS